MHLLKGYRSLRKKKHDEETATPATAERAHTVPSRSSAPETLRQRERDKEAAGLAELQRSRTLPREYLPGVYGVPSNNPTIWIATGNPIAGPAGGPVIGQLSGAPIPPFRPGYRPLPYQKPPKLRDQYYTRSWVRVPGPPPGTRVLLQDAPVLGTNYNATVHIDGSAPPPGYVIVGHSDVFPDGWQDYQYYQHPPPPQPRDPLSQSRVLPVNVARTSFSDERRLESGPILPSIIMPEGRDYQHGLNSGLYLPAMHMPAANTPQEPHEHHLDNRLASLAASRLPPEGPGSPPPSKQRYQLQQLPSLGPEPWKDPMPTPDALWVFDADDNRHTHGSSLNLLPFSTSEWHVQQYNSPSDQYPPMNHEPRTNVQSTSAMSRHTWAPQPRSFATGGSGSSGGYGGGHTSRSSSSPLRLSTSEADVGHHYPRSGKYVTMNPILEPNVESTFAMPTRSHAWVRHLSPILAGGSGSSSSILVQPNIGKDRHSLRLSPTLPLDALPGPDIMERSRQYVTEDMGGFLTASPRLSSPDEQDYQYDPSCALYRERGFVRETDPVWIPICQNDHGHHTRSSLIYDSTPPSSFQVRSYQSNQQRLLGLESLGPADSAPSSAAARQSNVPVHAHVSLSGPATGAPPPPTSNTNVSYVSTEDGDQQPHRRSGSSTRCPIYVAPRSRNQSSIPRPGDSDYVMIEDLTFPRSSEEEIRKARKKRWKGQIRAEPQAPELIRIPMNPAKVSGESFPSTRQSSRYSEKAPSRLSEAANYGDSPVYPRIPVVPARGDGEITGDTVVLHATPEDGLREETRKEENRWNDKDRDEPQAPEPVPSSIEPELVLATPDHLKRGRSRFSGRGSSHLSEVMNYEAEQNNVMSPVVAVNRPAADEHSHLSSGRSRPQATVEDAPEADSPVENKNDASDGWRTSLESSLDGAIGDILVELPPTRAKARRGFFGSRKKQATMPEKVYIPFSRSRLRVAPGADGVNTRNNGISNIAPPTQQSIELFDMSSWTRKQDAMPIAPDRVLSRGAGSHEHDRAQFQAGRVHQEGLPLPIATEELRSGARRQEAYSDGSYEHMFGHSYEAGFGPPSSPHLHPGPIPAVTSGGQMYGAPDGQFYLAPPQLDYGTTAAPANPEVQSYGAPDGQIYSQGGVKVPENAVPSSPSPATNQVGTIHHAHQDLYALPSASKVEAWNPIQQLNRVHFSNPSQPTRRAVALPSNVAILGPDGRPELEVHNGGAVGTANGPPLRVMELPNELNVEYYEMKAELARKRKARKRRLIMCGIALLMVPLPMIIYQFVFDRPDLDSL